MSLPRRRLPRVVPYMARHAILGFAIAALFVGGLFAFNIGGLETLVKAASWSTRLLAIGMLWFMTGLTFASAQMAFALMALSDDESGTGGWRRYLQGLAWSGTETRASIPIRVEKFHRRSRQ